MTARRWTIALAIKEAMGAQSTSRRAEIATADEARRHLIRVARAHFAKGIAALLQARRLEARSVRHKEAA